MINELTRNIIEVSTVEMANDLKKIRLSSFQI